MMPRRPELRFLPATAVWLRRQSLTKPARRDVIHERCQTSGFITRGFIAGIATARRKGHRLPAAEPDPESRECREDDGERCSHLVSRNQPDDGSRRLAGLQLAVETVALERFGVEGRLKLLEQSQRDVMQGAEPFGITHSRVRVRRWPLGAPSTHATLLPAAWEAEPRSYFIKTR